MFPGTVAELDDLSAEHETLDAELRKLSAAVDDLAACGPDDVARAVGIAALHAQPAAENVRDVLAVHLYNEEPVLKGLFPQVPDGDIRRLRKAVGAGASKSWPDLVLGLSQDPVPATGHDVFVRGFPPPVRWLRPVLLRRHNARKVTPGG